MIEAIVHGDEPGTAWGTYKFDALPSPGDRLVIGNNRGSLDILIVDYVEHHPVKVPASPMARPDPSVTVQAHFYESYGDDDDFP